MAAPSSRISLAVLLILIASPLSLLTAQEELETSQATLQLTTKQLRRFSVELSSLLAQHIDSEGDDVSATTVEAIRIVLTLVSAVEAKLNHCLIEGVVALASDSLSTVSLLRSDVLALQGVLDSLPAKTSANLSDLLTSLLSLISSLELEFSA